MIQNPAKYDPVGSVAVDINDLEFADGNFFAALVGTDLLQLDANTGAIVQTIALVPSRELGGLAIPEPSGVLLLCAGGSVMAGARRKASR